MLQKHLLSTVAYYDCLEYPLTAFEAWQHLLVLDLYAPSGAVSLGTVWRNLTELVMLQKLECINGMYVLLGRSHLVSQRIQEEKISVLKLKRVRRLIRWLAWIPFIRMIGIAGSLSMKKSDVLSDWDFFVILRAGRLWIGRTLLTGVLHLFGKRRYGSKIQDRACLNYYLSDGHLAVHPQDIYAANEYRFLLPILDRGMARSFGLANRWIARYKPQYRIPEISSLWTLPEKTIWKWLESVFDWDWLEIWLASWQKKKVLLNPKTKLEGSFIQVNGEALIFLPEPKGPIVFDRFKTRLGSIGLP